jgi:hypothetical protein
LEIWKRSVGVLKEDFLSTHNGLPFTYFDGNQMVKYQLASRSSQRVFCRRQPKPEGCEEHVFDPSLSNYGGDHFYLADNGNGLELYTNTMIPSGSYILLEDIKNDILISNSSANLIDQMRSLKTENAFAQRLDAVGAFMKGTGACPVRYLGRNMIRATTGPQMFASNKCTSRRQPDPYNPSLFRKAGLFPAVDRKYEQGDRI